MSRQVTPLWLAAVSDQLDVVDLLLDAGADVDAKASSGSSVLRAACCMSRLNVVKLLLQHSPKLYDDNQHKVTCLMNAVQNTELIQLLVGRGVKVNETDLHGNSALHHAINMACFSAVKKLIELGANPLIVNKDGLNAIQMATNECQENIVEYLLNNAHAKVSDIIEAYEVLGVMKVLKEANYSTGYDFWHKAMTLKQLNKNRNITKKNPRKSVLHQIYSAQEIVNISDLAAVSFDNEVMEIQALLMYERIRGPLNDSYIDLLMRRALVLAEKSLFRNSVNIQYLCYQLCQERYSKYDADKREQDRRALSRCVFSLVKVLYDALYEQQSQQSASDADFNQDCLIPEVLVRNICGLVKDHVALRFKHDETRFDMASLLKFCLLIFLAYTYIFSNTERHYEVGEALRAIVRMNPRDTDGKTLLHICFESLPEGILFIEKMKGLIQWPSKTLVDILLLLGSDPTSTDNHGNSALHAAARYHSQCNGFNTNIFSLLLARGAHSDQKNFNNQQAVDLLADCDGVRNVFQKISLKCLAARVVAENRIPYKGEVPVSLYSFIQLHE